MKTRITLIADPGMALTDGKEIGLIFHLETGRSADEFYEITEERAAEIEREQLAAAGIIQEV